MTSIVLGAVIAGLIGATTTAAGAMDATLGVSTGGGTGFVASALTSAGADFVVTAGPDAITAEVASGDGADLRGAAAPDTSGMRAPGDGTFSRSSVRRDAGAPGVGVAGGSWWSCVCATGDCAC